MSTYARLTRIKGNTKYKPAWWVDDYYGHYKYGVTFESNLVPYKEKCFYRPEEVEVYEGVMTEENVKEVNDFYALGDKITEEAWMGATERKVYCKYCKYCKVYAVKHRCFYSSALGGLATSFDIDVLNREIDKKNKNNDCKYYKPKVGLIQKLINLFK